MTITPRFVNSLFLCLQWVKFRYNKLNIQKVNKLKILLIGNGFDLAHNLPTNYRNFLEFCRIVKNIYESEPFLKNKIHQKIASCNLGDYIKQKLSEAVKSRKLLEKENNDDSNVKYYITSNNALNEFYSITNNNRWLEYFERKSSKMRENWIDFENEIANVVKDIDTVLTKLKNNKFSFDDEELKGNKTIEFLNYSRSHLKDITDISSLKTFISKLNTDLEKLIRALEIYIAAFVNNINLQAENEDVKNINPDCVLSFNYSNTFERMYDKEKKISYDYIHGKADINKNFKTCNMVLGIDEYLDDSKKDKDLELLPFKKFYQRIYKSTGNRYLNWIDQIKDDYFDYEKKINDAYASTVQALKDGSFDINPFHKKDCAEALNEKYEEHILYIFGHSLDVTDRDILKMFICNENVQTKIFYYREDEEDKRVLAQIIKNLIMIMGQDELIRRTGGQHKTIEFIPQAPSTTH